MTLFNDTVLPTWKHLVGTLLYTLLSFFFVDCAGQVPPDGGPIDREPPRIISTYPAPYTTRFNDTKIVLEFDEYVDRRSVQESIFISPYLGELEFDWSGREVEIRFSEPLHENRTYVVNIGTDVVDLNNRNRMAQAFTLAFSTGDVIDKGMIEGKVFGATSNDSPEGVMIFAYLLTPDNPDTLNPRTTKPDYITQTGQQGNFALRHLLLGTYRLLAVRDEYRNLLYDPQVDEYGVPAFDIHLSVRDTVCRNVTLRLAKDDTTAPRLLTATSLDRTHLLVEFSEAIDTASVATQHFSLRDTASHTALSVRAAAPILSKPTTVLLVTEPLQSAHGYRLTAEQIRDAAGNVVHPLARSVSFTAASAPDTSRPTLASCSLSDSTRGVPLEPTFLLTFSDILEKSSVEHAISVRDSTGTNAPFVLNWVNAMGVELRFSPPLMSKRWYVVAVDLARLKNLNGVSGASALRTYRFETLDIETLSSIEGTALDRHPSDTTGAIVLTAERLGVGSQHAYTVQLPKPGAFALRGLPEGKYLLRAYRDRNGNGVYDAGRPVPFVPSERFAVYPDTLQLRARWPLEGVLMELK
jgi:hypothetical protein